MATGDATFVIRSDLYEDTPVLQATIEGFAGKAGTLTYDFSNCFATISDSGYSAADTPATQNRTILITDIYRVPGSTSKAESDSGSDLVVNLSLSESIYSGSSNVEITMPAGWATDGGDSTTAVNAQSATNNSTISYPKCAAIWAVPHDYVVTDTDGILNLAIFAYQRLGRERKPLAGIKFSVSDGTNPALTSNVNSLTKQLFEVSGFYAPLYADDVNVSSLNSGELTVDCTFYPVIGDSFTLSVDASAHPSANLSVLKAVNNYNNGYGVVYADVTSGGNDGAGTVNNTGLGLSAFATVNAALNACRTYNNANYGRDTVSNARVRLDANTYVHTNINKPVDLAPCFIESADVANKETTIYQEPATNIFSGLPSKIVFKDLTLQKVSGSNIIAFDSNNGAGSAGLNGFNNVTFNDSINSGNSYGAWIYRAGRVYIYNCDGNAKCISGIVGNVNKTMQVVGSNGFFFGQTLFGALASKTLSGGFSAKSAGAAEETIGTVLAFCFFGIDAASGSSITYNIAIGERGFHVLSSIIEHKGGDTSAAVTISADNITSPAVNINGHHCTIVGARTNCGYNEVGTVAVKKEAAFKHAIFQLKNVKGDLFPTVSGNRDGNWNILWNINSRNIITIEGSNNSSSWFDNSWLGQIASPNDQTGSTVTPLNADFLDNASFSGTDLGDGDYTLGENTEINEVDTGTFLFPFDMYGNEAGTGTNLPGAVMRNASGGAGDLDKLYTIIGVGVGVGFRRN